ncbi:MAG: class I SAM-dependent methyltransferase, partial [Rhodothermales bacterium]
MFNNLVSVHDFEKVATRFRQGGMVRYVHRMFQAPERRVASAWQHTESTARRWTDIPAVRERCNHLITGNRHGDPRQFFIDTFLPDRSNLTALSLACGTGSNELAWARKGVFSRIVGVDISPDRIAVATDAARTEGLSDVLRFEVRDVQAKLPDGPFDLVIAEGALHHLSNLSRLLPEITGILRPEGYLVLNDFVGPSRFQWTDRQLEIIDGLLLVLPDSYRHRRVTGDIK